MDEFAQINKFRISFTEHLEVDTTSLAQIEMESFAKEKAIFS